MNDINFRIKQFEEFYDCLMSNAPEGYSPWFFACKPKGKDPDTKGSWHDETARLTKEQCIERIKQGGNIGISARKDDPLIIGDIDELEYMNQMPKNTLTTISRKRQGGHFFGWDKDGTAKINLPTNYGELRSSNQYVLACGSYTPFDHSFQKDRDAFAKLSEESQEDKLLGFYTIDNKCSPKDICFNDLPEFFKNKAREDIENETKILQKEETNTYKNSDGKYSELFKLKVSDIVGVIPSNKRIGHPLHESDTDANWSLSKDGSLGHCWRHLVSLNAVQYLCVKAGYCDCLDAGTPHKGRGISKLRGDKNAFEVAYNEALKLGLIKKWKNEKNKSYMKMKELPMVLIYGDGLLMSKIAQNVADVFYKHEILFYKQELREIVEVSKIKHDEEDKSFLGFSIIKPKRFITLSEKYFIPYYRTWKADKDGETGFWENVPKSLSNDKAGIILVSPHFQEKMPIIKRIFSIPFPMMYDGELTFPKVGYDNRFYSWLSPSAPNINFTNVNVERAKEIISEIFKEFCFETKQDYTNAVAALITPFLRGIFPEFTTRTPMFFYVANRERAGKDYLASITGLLLEGQALDEPPISDGEKGGNKNDELRKKILSCLLQGRRRLHFANNKGRLNNSVLEAALTSKKFSDRILGKSEVISLDNELDISASGNVGITFTPDLSNRCVFIKLFLDIENANEREFENPNLHGWVINNRSKILSAIFCLINDWIKKGSVPGKKKFASYPEWASICGGIMENAGFGSPCIPNDDALVIGGDSESQEMKQLFEVLYERFGEKEFSKQELVNFIKNDNSLFPYTDWDNKADQIKFGQKLIKFYGRIFSGIKMHVINPKDRPARHRLLLIKKFGNVGSLGNVLGSSPQKNPEHNKNNNILFENVPIDSPHCQHYQETKNITANRITFGNDENKKIKNCPKCNAPMVENKCIGGCE